jgi:hypothetical protein
MADNNAPAQTSPWSNVSKAVRATHFPSSPKLRPTLSNDTLSQMEEDARSLSRQALIGFAPTKHPSRIELQEWINVNLVEPSMIVSRIQMLQCSYFVPTFENEEGAKLALQQSPLNFGVHNLYLHPWKPQFDPQAPKGIADSFVD